MNGVFREFLKKELDRRVAKSPGYSLRAFARFLGIQPARLSEFLNGKAGLSVKRAHSILERIGVRGSEREHLLDSVSADFSRSKRERERARTRLLSREEEILKADEKRLSEETFQVVSEWYHFALLELMEIPGFDPNPNWMGARLGISPLEAKRALERLLRVGLAYETEGGSYAPSESTTFSPDGVPSKALRKAQNDLIEKALSSLEGQPVTERDASSTLLKFSPSRFPEAIARIRAFKREFAKEFGHFGAGEEVYSLSVQFFRLTNPLNNSKKNGNS